MRRVINKDIIFTRWAQVAFSTLSNVQQATLTRSLDQIRVYGSIGTSHLVTHLSTTKKMVIRQGSLRVFCERKHGKLYVTDILNKGVLKDIHE